MKAKSLRFSQDFHSIEGEITSLNAAEIVSNKLVTKDLMTSVIISQTNAIVISALLKVTGQIRYESNDDKKTSFIQLSHENLYLDNVRQWKLIKEYKMNDVNNRLNEYLALMLFKEKSQISQNSHFEVDKNLNITSKWIEHVMIESNFKFLNSIWNNNTAYVKVGEDLYWLEHHNWQDEDCDEGKWSSQIKIVIPYRKKMGSSLKITFGVKITEEEQKCAELLDKMNLTELISFEDLHISVK